MSHIPVMPDEVLAALQARDGETYVDGTFGGGGHSRAILKAANCHLIALDRDPNIKPQAKEVGVEFGPRFRFIETRFSKLVEVIGEQKVDGIVLDIGVSSMQIDQGERGFSFMREGPLDMRMSGKGPTASSAVNYLDHNDLVRIFKVYGEEKHARRCADCIVTSRNVRPITTTQDLAELMSSAFNRKGKRHPATRVFQALRVYINDELGELYRALLASEQVLNPGGRLVVVTFHSLEDRIVKSFFRTRSTTQKPGSRYLPVRENNIPAQTFFLPKPMKKSPTKREVETNRRARSACLRSAIRTGAVNILRNDNLLPDVPGLEVLLRKIA